MNSNALYLDDFDVVIDDFPYTIPFSSVKWDSLEELLEYMAHDDEWGEMVGNNNLPLFELFQVFDKNGKKRQLGYDLRTKTVRNLLLTVKGVMKLERAMNERLQEEGAAIRVKLDLKDKSTHHGLDQDIITFELDHTDYTGEGGNDLLNI